MAVERGKYSIYTVPSQTQWEQTRALPLPDGAMGESSYTAEVEAQEVGRAAIQTRAVGFTEQFTAGFGEATQFAVELWFDWEETRVVVPVRLLRGAQ